MQKILPENFLPLP